MAKLIKFFELNTGAKIPSVGLGTWQAEPGVVAEAITKAIEVTKNFTSINIFPFFNNTNYQRNFLCYQKL